MRQRFSEFGMMVDMSSVLDKFVFVFLQSAAVQKYGAPKTIGWQFWLPSLVHFAPPL